MRTVTTSECDSFDEVRKLFERAFGEIDEINFVIAPTKEKYLKEIAEATAKAKKQVEAKAAKEAKAQAKAKRLAEAQAIIDKAKAAEEATKRDANKRATELKEAKEIIAASKKKKGFVSMKLLVFIVVFVCLFAGICYAPYSTTDINYDIASNPETLARYLRDSFANLDGTSVIFTPTDTAPPATEGTVYYNDTAKNLRLRTDSAWVDIDVSGASSLDTAYGIGVAITVDNGAVTLTAPNANDNVALALIQQDTAGTVAALTVGSAGDAAAIIIAQTGSGTDIEGTDGWSISKASALIIEGGITDLTDSSAILMDTNNEIQFGDNSEDVSFGFGTSDTLTWTTDTSVATVAWGDLDAHTGLNALAFDAAVANTITQTGTGDTDDLTISQAGTVDCSLILQSAGSVSDALSLITSDGVGSIKIASADNLDVDAADDITVDTAAGGYTLTVGGSTLGKYISTVADTYSLTVVDTLLIRNTEASKDITVNSVLGSIRLLGEEDAANAILIEADGGTNTTLRVWNDTGTGAQSIYLLSDVGGITATASAGLVALNATGASAGDMTLTAGDLFAIASVDSVDIDSSAGDVTISANAAGKDLNLDSVLGSINIEAEEDAANAVLIVADGGTNTTMQLHSQTGTGAQSLYLLSTVGSVEIEAKAAGKDIIVNSVLGNVQIEGEEDAADAVQIIADGGTNTTLKIFNDTGTGAGSIYMLTDVGGITLTASAAGKDILVNSVLGQVRILGEEDAEAILIEADGGTSTTLKIWNDTGTTATSLYLLSDVGGITQTASAGAFVFNATGGATGDWTCTVGDEYILAVTGGIATGSAEEAADAIGLTASGTAGGITLNTGTAGITCSGDFLKDYKREVEEITTATDTLLAAESGTIYISSYTGTQTITLPDAAAGLYFTFIDGSSTAGDDLIINPQSGDKIDKDTAGQEIRSSTDAYPQVVTLVSEDGVDWWTKSRVGTWAQE